MLLHGGIECVLELGALEFQLVYLLVAGVFHLLLDAADFIVELVIFLEGHAELSIRQLERADGFAVRRELFYERVMQVDWKSSRLKVDGR